MEETSMKCALTGGTCVFHKENSLKLNIVYDWHLAEKERMKSLDKKIDRLNVWIGGGVIAIVVDIIVRLIPTQ